MPKLTLKSAALSGALTGFICLSGLPQAAMASDMTVQQFLTLGQNIPRNRAAAMLKPETRRLIGEVTSSVRTVKSEQAAAESAGRTPRHCIPASGTGITPEALVARFETMSEARRRVSVTQAIRDWMVERYPCAS